MERGLSALSMITPPAFGERIITRERLWLLSFSSFVFFYFKSNISSFIAFVDFFNIKG